MEGAQGGIFCVVCAGDEEATHDFEGVEASAGGAVLFSPEGRAVMFVDCLSVRFVEVVAVVETGD